MWKGFSQGDGRLSTRNDGSKGLHLPPQQKDSRALSRFVGDVSRFKHAGLTDHMVLAGQWLNQYIRGDNRSDND
jgi:hypothetical protein